MKKPTLKVKTAGLRDIPVLCRFWREDRVWNGVAEDLPVAVLGKTFEAAQENLREAIEQHCSVLIEAGEFTSAVRRLRDRSRATVALKSMVPGAPVVKMLLARERSGRLTVAA